MREVLLFLPQSSLYVSNLSQLILSGLTLMTRHKGRMEEDGFKLSGEGEGARETSQKALLSTAVVVVNQAQNADFLTT